MDRCDSCSYVYATLPTGATQAQLRSLAGAYRDRLTSHDAATLRARPEPEVWSALEYAGHVRDVFEVQRERTVLALAEETPMFVPMGRDERVVVRRYNEQDPVVVTAELAEAAETLAITFESLDESDWTRTGIYTWPTRSVRDLAWLARHTVHEGIHHLRDIDAGLR